MNLVLREQVCHLSSHQRMARHGMFHMISSVQWVHRDAYSAGYDNPCPTGHDGQVQPGVLPVPVPGQWAGYSVPCRTPSNIVPHCLAGSSSTWQASGEPPRQPGWLPPLHAIPLKRFSRQLRGPPPAPSDFHPRPELPQQCAPPGLTCWAGAGMVQPLLPAQPQYLVPQKPACRQLPWQLRLRLRCAGGRSCPSAWGAA